MTKIENAAIGDNIRKYRELRGYSQDYMANMLGLTQSAYSKIEKQTVKLTFDHLQRIAEILEIDLANLINTKNQNVFNMYNNQSANGYIEIQHIEMKDVYEKLIAAKDEQIEFLKSLLEKKL